VHTSTAGGGVGGGGAAGIPRVDPSASPPARAVLWRKRAQYAQALVETPGWAVLARRLADRAWAACWLKSTCPPEMAATLDALVQGILAPIRKLQECIDLGACAEAWFQRQEQKAAKEGA